MRFDSHIWRRQIRSVVADHSAGGQVQRRGGGRTNVVDVEIAVKQPGDQVDALLSRTGLQAVE